MSTHVWNSSPTVLQARRMPRHVYNALNNGATFYQAIAYGAYKVERDRQSGQRWQWYSSSRSDIRLRDTILQGAINSNWRFSRGKLGHMYKLAFMLNLSLMESSTRKDFLRLNRRWLSGTVRELMKVEIETPVEDRLPIIADALMDAGCDDEELIAALQSRHQWPIPYIAQHIIERS